MAIMFNADALSRFANVDFDDNEQIVEKKEEPPANDGKFIDINAI